MKGAVRSTCMPDWLVVRALLQGQQSKGSHAPSTRSCPAPFLPLGGCPQVQLLGPLVQPSPSRTRPAPASTVPGPLSAHPKRHPVPKPPWRQQAACALPSAPQAAPHSPLIPCPRCLSTQPQGHPSPDTHRQAPPRPAAPCRPPGARAPPSAPQAPPGTRTPHRCSRQGRGLCRPGAGPAARASAQ